MTTHILDDRDVAVSPVCTSCIHWQGGRKCKAYPFGESIPLDIWCGDDGHTKPRLGDNGIQFEQNPKRQLPTLGDDNLDNGDL